MSVGAPTKILESPLWQCFRERTVAARSANKLGDSVLSIWIFQANPDLFDVNAYLSMHLPHILWLTETNSKDILPEDKVYIWRSGGKRRQRQSTGIIAEAKVVEQAELRMEDEFARYLWKGGDNRGDLPRNRAKLRLLKVANEGHLLTADEIKSHFQKQDIPLPLIIRRPAGTNFQLTPDEDEAIKKLWSKIRRTSISDLPLQDNMQDNFDRLVRNIEDDSLNNLMSRYKKTNKGEKAQASKTQIEVERFDRNPLAVAITRKRAIFKCEVPRCTTTAFLTESGKPYCEVHHIVPLSEGGADEIKNMVCICPAHHREAHWGANRAAIAAALTQIRRDSD